jgi:hypothetical protein
MRATYLLLVAAATLRLVAQAPAWEASPKELRFHSGLPAATRAAIYTAVLAKADSIVDQTWGTPDSWARIQGHRPTGRANTLCLDPGIRSASLLTPRPAWGPHDLTWAGGVASSPPFVGFCSLDATSQLAMNGPVTMAISLSTISPVDARRVLVHLSMRRVEQGQRGFASEWAMTLTATTGGWVVSGTIMNWLT